jgi:1-deoxy-D-xylulose-5-phosphate reductoisomerase
LVLLGSTGSIGTSALKVIARHPDAFRVLALSGARNVELLARQADQWRPPHLAVLNAEAAEALRALLPAGYAPRIHVGREGYEALAVLDDADMILAAQVGAAGLPPTMAAARAGKLIALANKEALVLAGDAIRQACHASGAVLLPVDSEHNALFQGLCGHAMDDLRRIVLTASGGPFRGRDAAFLQSVTREQALNHPNWSMGAKISVDSATLMNKGLEVIEACHLYGVDVSRVAVVVHPQSIVHSLVEYHDGSLLAHLGPPDMQIPIAYCLGWPQRLALDLEPLDLLAMGDLTFEPPNPDVFPCLRLAMECAGRGGLPVVLNAANEVAVQLFLEDAVPFARIPALIEEALEALETEALAAPSSLEAILDLDREARRLAGERARSG